MIGCSEHTIRHYWCKDWAERDSKLAKKVDVTLDKAVKCMVQVERHQLDHLLSLRELCNNLKDKIMEQNDTEPHKLVPLFRELRETIMASAKLEGVEPPTRNININAEAPLDDLMAALRKIQKEQEER